MNRAGGQQIYNKINDDDDDDRRHHNINDGCDDAESGDNDGGGDGISEYAHGVKKKVSPTSTKR